ncbi:hypothetical protein [Streptomyces colonosanans]|uniref:Uncharacterized protein n=1 Tax=Streptomyces colonosanans TaxID=1428652 RepID=A0A1S2NT60_9ACTN|nr:hypothetical protein [Streptomyces colonosanans]OIJ84748.1 hypothetical protein BIV24_30245 [Streptomyces colonosanans]
MWILLHPHSGGQAVAALGMPPVWTQFPVADRPGVAAAVLAAAFVALVVGTRARQGRFRRFRDARGKAAEPVDASWFTAHTLDGFPEEAVRARLRGPDAPSVDCLYAAWVLAVRGMDAVWLEKNLSLPADVAHLIVEAAEPRRRNRESQEDHDEPGPGGPPGGAKAEEGTAGRDSVPGSCGDDRRRRAGPAS